MHPKPLVRRTHSPEFKARVLAACRQTSASIAAVALAHGINANVVHKWLAGINFKRAGLHLQAALQSTPSPVTPMQFLPLGLGASGPERGVSSGTQDIHLDLDLGTLQIKLNCPRGSAPSAAVLLHALAGHACRCRPAAQRGGQHYGPGAGPSRLLVCQRSGQSHQAAGA